ncbi:putative protein of unknown function, transcription is upregulated in an RHE model of oral candidiasis, partial [Candida albicans P76067]
FDVDSFLNQFGN